jgi:phage RecT family recombinase
MKKQNQEKNGQIEFKPVELSEEPKLTLEEPTLSEPPPTIDAPIAPVEEKKKPMSTIQRFNHYLDNYKQGILPDLLKKHNIEPSQFVHIVVSEIKKNEKLLNAFQENPSSMFASILAGAEIGLIPSEMLGEFYLIPRKIDGKLTVTPLIGYKGMHNIILRSGEVTKVHTECVYEGDEFTPIYGLEPNIIHKPNFNVVRDSNTLKFVYAVAKLRNGEYQFAVLSKGDVIKINQLSRYNNDLYFNDKKDPNMWMVRKTALFQLAKLLPKDFYAKKAIDMDGQLEGGAYLSLDDENNIKIVDGKKIASTKQASVINTFNSLPDIPE